MDKECPHCHALKFKNEPAGMSCASGKVQLPEIETPPEPLNGLLIGTDPDSNVFLNLIRTFNSCLQMTSIGATEIVRNFTCTDDGVSISARACSESLQTYRIRKIRPIYFLLSSCDEAVPRRRFFFIILFNFVRLDATIVQHRCLFILRLYCSGVLTGNRRLPRRSLTSNTS